MVGAWGVGEHRAASESSGSRCSVWKPLGWPSAARATAGGHGAPEESAAPLGEWGRASKAAEPAPDVALSLTSACSGGPRVPVRSEREAEVVQALCAR